MKAISSLVNVDSIDNDKNLEGGFSAESIVMPDPDSLPADPDSLTPIPCGTYVFPSGINN